MIGNSALTIIDDQINSSRQEAEALVLGNKEQYKAAAQLSLAYKALENDIKRTFAPIIEKSYAAWKEAIAAREKRLVPVLEIQKIIDAKSAAWYQSEEVRLKAGQAAREAQSVKLQEDQKLDQALRLADSGREEEAEAVLESPAISTVPKEQPTKISGYSVVIKWGFEIIDPSILPREYLVADEIKIGKAVKIFKNQTNIPGVKILKTYGTVKSEKRAHFHSTRKNVIS